MTVNRYPELNGGSGSGNSSDRNGKIKLKAECTSNSNSNSGDGDAAGDLSGNKMEVTLSKGAGSQSQHQPADETLLSIGGGSKENNYYKPNASCNGDSAPQVGFSPLKASNSVDYSPLKELHSESFMDLNDCYTATTVRNPLTEVSARDTGPFSLRKRPRSNPIGDSRDKVSSSPILASSSSSVSVQFQNNSSASGTGWANWDSNDHQSIENERSPPSRPLSRIFITPVRTPSRNVSSNSAERGRSDFRNRDIKSNPRNLSSRMSTSFVREPGVMGLNNIGNTCFMNSGLQCLLSTPPLIQYFLKLNMNSEVWDISRSKCGLLRSFSWLTKHAWAGDRDSLELSTFKKRLGAVHSDFNDYRQQDVQEFLVLFLDSLHQQLKEWNAIQNQSGMPQTKHENLNPHLLHIPRITKYVHNLEQQRQINQGQGHVQGQPEMSTKVGPEAVVPVPAPAAATTATATATTTVVTVVKMENEMNQAEPSKTSLDRFLSNTLSKINAAVATAILPNDSNSRPQREIKLAYRSRVTPSESPSSTFSNSSGYGSSGLTHSEESSNTLLQYPNFSPSRDSRAANRVRIRPPSPINCNNDKRKVAEVKPFNFKNNGNGSNGNVKGVPGSGTEFYPRTGLRTYEMRKKPLLEPSTEKRPVKKPKLMERKVDSSMDSESLDPAELEYSDERQKQIAEKSYESLDLKTAKDKESALGACLQSLRLADSDISQNEDLLELNERALPRLQGKIIDPKGTHINVTTTATVIKNEIEMDWSPDGVASSGKATDIKRMARRKQNENETSCVAGMENPGPAKKMKTEINSAEDFWEDYLEKDDSVITRSMKGLMKSTVTCSSCQFQSVTYEPFMDLFLPIPCETYREITFWFVNMDNFGSGELGEVAENVKYRNICPVPTPEQFTAPVRPTCTVGEFKRNVIKCLDDCGVFSLDYSSKTNLLLMAVSEHLVVHEIVDSNLVREFSDNFSLYLYVLNQNFNFSVHSRTSSVSSTDAASFITQEDFDATFVVCDGEVTLDPFDSDTVVEESSEVRREPVSPVATATSQNDVSQGKGQEPSLPLGGMTDEGMMVDSTDGQEHRKPISNPNCLEGALDGPQLKAWGQGHVANSSSLGPTMNDSASLKKFSESTTQVFHLCSQCMNSFAADVVVNHEGLDCCDNVYCLSCFDDGLCFRTDGVPLSMVDPLAFSQPSFTTVAHEGADQGPPAAVVNSSPGKLPLNSNSNWKPELKEEIRQMDFEPLSNSPPPRFPKCARSSRFTPTIPVPILFRNVSTYFSSGTGRRMMQRLFGHPWVLNLPVEEEIRWEELYGFFEVLNPLPGRKFELLSVTLDGVHCGICSRRKCSGCQFGTGTDGYVMIPTETAICFSYRNLQKQIIKLMETPEPEMPQGPAECFQESMRQVVKSQDTFRIHDCIDALMRTENLDLDNPWWCPNCKKNRAAEKTMSVSLFPDYLIVCLKRFVFNSDLTSTKLRNHVKFPLKDLDLSRYLSPEMKTSERNKNCVFDLYACVCHSGSLSSGHYTAYTKNPLNKEWNFYNDSVCTKETPGYEQCSSAYALFFKRQETQYTIPVIDLELELEGMTMSNLKNMHLSSPSSSPSPPPSLPLLPPGTPGFSPEIRRKPSPSDSPVPFSARDKLRDHITKNSPKRPRLNSIQELESNSPERPRPLTPDIYDYETERESSPPACNGISKMDSENNPDSTGTVICTRVARKSRSRNSSSSSARFASRSGKMNKSNKGAKPSKCGHYERENHIKWEYD